MTPYSKRLIKSNKSNQMNNNSQIQIPGFPSDFNPNDIMIMLG